ncbi:MAG: bifunctional 23S rRNA (guanine(2069)-N(7))-methyltransferase RlmK/23S rRNA (guanine(2445)-N(2))-methyltransferase RlmL [Collinsella sp.]
MEFYASCPEGFESALADELKRLGLSHVRRLKGRATFEGELEEGYRACLWSRLASRVFVVLGRFEAQDADELYDSVYDIAWETIIRPGATIAITARGVTEQLRNTRFSALRAKDALCDRLAETTGRRADVDAADPDVHLLLSLRQRRASISLDLSGDPLFKRLPPAATRAGEGTHVLRPDYAALVLAQVGWTALCERELTADDYENEALPTLIDASCAGGGLLLEAVNILTDRAPGAARERWGFEGWQPHDAALWEQLLAEAREREAAARERQARIVAVDVDPAARKTAERMVKCAGYKRFVDFCAAKSATVLDHAGAVAGAAVVADTTETPLSLMHDAMTLIGELRRAPELAAAPVAALTRDGLLARALHAEPERSIAVMPNNEEATVEVWPSLDNAAGTPMPEPAAMLDLGDGKPLPVLIPESEQFANRLRKNARLRRKWAKREGVTCYRVYDADLPDYSAAIDLYEGCPQTPGRWLVIAEYAAPKTIDPALAQARMLDILAIAPRILDVPAEHVHAKARMRSRGGSQYGKQGAGKGGSGERANIARRRLPLIEEGGLTFAVNFDDYLDVGIFLDHRVTRNLVREHAKQARRFLNLFAYTGTATCYAADGGVEETVTVDLSNTYLDWAERNMRQNGFVGPQHHFVRDDVLAWIRDQRQTRNRWDLIFVDPPTFSNSSKMGRRTWDVQRDHVELLAGVSRLLAQGGHAIFSCNLRGFRPETRKLARAGVVLEDITAQTIPEDFARNQKVHHCYIVRRLPIEDAMAEVGFSAEEIAERVEELRNPEARKPQSALRPTPTGSGKPSDAAKPKKKKFYASKPKNR